MAAYISKVGIQQNKNIIARHVGEGEDPNQDVVPVNPPKIKELARAFTKSLHATGLILHEIKKEKLANGNKRPLSSSERNLAG